MERPSESGVLRFQTAFLFFTADFRCLSPSRNWRIRLTGLGGKAGRIGLLKRPLLRQCGGSDSFVIENSMPKKARNARKHKHAA